MAKEKKKAAKKRAEQYEAKVSFDGTFEDMIAISLKGADEVVKKRNSAKKSTK